MIFINFSVFILFHFYITINFLNNLHLFLNNLVRNFMKLWTNTSATATTNVNFNNFFKKINSFLEYFFNFFSFIFNNSIFIILLILFFLNLDIDLAYSFYSTSDSYLYSIFNSAKTPSNDLLNFNFFENLILNFNHFYLIVCVFSYIPRFFIYCINFFEMIFFKNISSFLELDSYISYDFFLRAVDTVSFSVFTETNLNFIFFKLISIVDYFLKNWFDFNYDFFYNNPVFFYTGLLFLLSTILSLLLMSYLGLYGVFIFNLITLFTFWVSVVFYIDFFFSENNFFKIIIGRWFTLFGSFNVNFEFYVDSVSYSFMLLTVTIAMFVYIYVYSYFRYDANVERLILFINSFVISMVVLVVSGNLFVFFLGWELIGLTSFLLINFWSTRISTLKSAFKAYTFNKFSDVSILISCLLIILLINDVNILTFNGQISFYKNYYLVIFGLDCSVVELISFFFIFAAFIKSAQFGAHIWLPDSMEAPVPASALIHSATLVSAGVFLLLRFSPIFEISTYAFYVIPLVGSFTAFFGGIGACYQSDIKRILAYSTISHCGFLMVSYSIFVPEYTILYLYIHGFFKAAVFLCAGNIIRFSRNYQDFKRMGLFFKYLPFEFCAAFICLMNLCGLPFTIGFYIKHLLVVGLSSDNFIFYFVFVNIIGGAVSGLFYSYKFFFYSFLDVKKAKKVIYDSASTPQLNSFFYSNSSLASNIAISLLIVVSYFISLKLFGIFLNKNSIGSGLDIHSVYSSLNSELVLPTISFLENVSIFNWLILLLIISLAIVSWRFVYKFYNTIKSVNFLIVLVLFIYVFVHVISLIF